MMRSHHLIRGAVLASGSAFWMSQRSLCTGSQQPTGEELEQAFSVFDGRTGVRHKISHLVDRVIGDVDVLIIGEQHDDRVAHFVEKELLELLLRNSKEEGGRPLALSLEQFEADTQTVVDEYLHNHIGQQDFLNDARPWPNYQSDYSSLIELAKSYATPVIASNAPRRYVSLTVKSGQEALLKLSDISKAFLPPLPVARASEAYALKFARVMESMSSNDGECRLEQTEVDCNTKMLQAQSLWDCTMSFFISQWFCQQKNVSRAERPLCVHVCGSFHCEHNLGIPEHLARFQPNLRIMTVVCSQEQEFQAFNEDRHGGLGDFVILTDAGIPPSYPEPTPNSDTQSKA